MAVTQNTYTGNGTTTNYSFTFPYLETTDIKVSVNGVDTTAYTLANATTVSFNTAPANGAAIRIYRDTDDSTLAATFYPGSAIRSQDLNDNFTQNLYVTQEVNNNAVVTDGSNPMIGDLDVGLNKIVNVGSPTDSLDATNKSYVDSVATNSSPSFTQNGTGATSRTWDSKLKDVVSIKDFGAVGDGITNDRAAIQAALNTGKNIYIPDGIYLFNSSINYTAGGQTIYGSGNNSVLKSGAGSVYINTNGKNNVGMYDLKLDGDGTNGGYLINGGSSNVTVSRIYWYKGGQRVWLFTCSSVKVLDCTFESTGYGIIQQIGHASSFVLISGNTAIDMVGDFVEANCESGTPSSSWTITDNVYKGSNGYPTPATEKRFVGITSVNGVVIDGNVVEDVAGDAAIHLENTLGETVISNNVFDNCLGDGGNVGYIYLLNSGENTVVNGNIFLRTDAGLTSAYALQCNNNYANKIQFTGNRVVGTSAGSNFSGLRIGDSYGQKLISDNVFEKLDIAIDAPRNTSNVIFNGNFIIDTANALAQQVTSAGSGYRNWLISNNVFTGTTGTYDILTRENTNGTSAPKNVFIANNKFCKAVTVRGLIGGVVDSENDATDIQVTNNIFSSAASLSFNGTMSRRVSTNNTFESDGTYDVNATTVNTTTLNATGLGNFESTIDYRPLKNRTHFSDYQNGVSLSGTSAQYNISDNSVQQFANTSSTLNIGNGFILPKNYSGTLTYTVGTITAGAFTLHLESSIDGVTWTSLQSSNSGSTGAKTYAFSSLTDATALRFRFQNSNGTTGNITVNSVVIPGLTAAQIAQATGNGRVILNQPHFPNISTTASAANAFIDNATTPINRLLRSTSSIRYKTDVEDLDHQKANAILGLRPVWYRSLAEADPSEWSYYGLIAEEVAEIEPRLVTWTYLPEAYETVEETVDVDGVITTQQVTRLKSDAKKVPDGVGYERLSVLLLDVVKGQQEAIKTLKAEVASINTRLANN